MVKTRSTAITSRKRIAATKAAPTSKAISKPVSYILRAVVGGKDGKSSAKKTATKSKPLWDAEQLSVG